MPNIYEQLKQEIFKIDHELGIRINNVNESSVDNECAGCVFKIFARHRLQEINLEDILRVIKNKINFYNDDFRIITDGTFFYNHNEYNWQLGEPLHLQSKETQKALLDILK